MENQHKRNIGQKTIEDMKNSLKEFTRVENFMISVKLIRMEDLKIEDKS